MQMYIFRHEQKPFTAIFRAHSQSHARLRAALISFTVLSCQELPNLTDIRVHDDSDSNGDAAYFPDSFISPIEQCLSKLFASCSVRDP
jgi:hypothetical protein